MSAARSHRLLRNVLIGMAAAASLGAVALAVFAPSPAPPVWTPPAAVRDGAASAASGAQSVPAAPVREAEQVPAFRRGVNLSRLLSFSSRDPARPGKYLSPPFQGDLAVVTDAELDRLRGLGFDFVRLPVDVGPFLEAGEDELGSLFDMMRQSVMRLRRHGLTVLLDMHPSTYRSNWRPEDILADPRGAKFERYGKFLEQVAGLFGDQPADGFALELMNEPQPACDRKDGEDWTISQKRLFDAVRAVAPEMPVVLTGGCWASADGLMRLDPVGYDAATLYDFHFYEPYYFTHQSIPWASPPGRYLAGLTYPAATGSLEVTLNKTKAHIARMEKDGTPQPADAFASARKYASSYYGRGEAGPKTIAARFDEITAWAKANGVAPGRIVVGEFSAIRWPDGVEDDGSRLRWIADARAAAEDHGFGWALWDYYEGFGLLADNASRTVDSGTASALGLDVDALRQ
ncbi:cellulase family glycosylhydrolase [Oricola nitratireducens]|uniref:cellulase family glycosylhydrolase n=1 Tax=Oricola nitratireducens TaxID=2775868 RepID=UPI0018682467